MQFLRISVRGVLLQRSRKRLLLLRVHFGTGTCVHRLLELFSWVLGFPNLSERFIFQRSG